MEKKRLVIGISGASAPIYGIRTLELLQDLPDVETHLVYTRAAVRTISIETECSMDYVKSLSDVCYETDDISASIASGSFRTTGMIIAPCSMSTMSCIAGSITKDLLTRAAEVVLKEKRPLVLMCRESPLHLGHLRRMVELAEMGAHIAPPIPAFYQKPQTIDDLVNHSIGRALDIFGLECPWVKRWSNAGSGDTR